MTSERTKAALLWDIWGLRAHPLRPAGDDSSGAHQESCHESPEDESSDVREECDITIDFGLMGAGDPDST